ncbi:MAG TPA: HEAT repeat domain-containing protein [Gemmatimonadales bacterium]|nr:HEAT repeat domain-containing protein [Gemmatimonadales bacterium]
MTALQFLWVVAVVQGVLLVALIILIILNRWFRLRRSARLQPRRQELDAAMQRWTLGQAPAAEVERALARLPASLAIDALVTWSARVPGERWQELSRALARQWWARVVRTNYRSARWWKRLECARFLSVAATQHDLGRVLRLLRDHHPAVQIAAATTLERMTSPVLVNAALEQLPQLGPTVQAYYASVLRRARSAVVRHLQPLLRRPEDPRLPRVIEFAGRLEDPGLREPFTALATHRDPEVRSQVARALGKYPHAESIAALRLLAQDGAWPVRAQAIRSLGVIADGATLPLVRDALWDPEWWVRLRAGLALTRFGGVGRNALLTAEVSAHDQSRDMARLVLGLTPQALAEYAA